MARKSYIRLEDALKNQALVRMVLLFGIGPLLAIGWPPDLKHRWGLLIPPAIVCACVAWAYVMARRFEKASSGYRAMTLSEPDPPGTLD